METGDSGSCELIVEIVMTVEIVLILETVVTVESGVTIESVVLWYSGNCVESKR